MLNHLAGLVGLCLIAVLCHGQGVAKERAVDVRPNILLLMAEDLSPRVGAWGDSVARTPHIDALAEAGVRYTNVFTTAGVCAPSRAAMITGLYQMSFGAQHMRTSTSSLGEYYAVPDIRVRAFPELMRAAGYYTFTDDKLDYQFSGIRAGSGPFSIWDAEGRDAHWRGRDPGQPFFGLINFLETHESGVMRPGGVPHSVSHLASQRMRALAGLVSQPVTRPGDVKLPSYYPDLPEVRRDLARHYDNIAAMDTRVGRILARLREDRLHQNTIVIWTTDHGDGLPRAKRELYDSGIHVPMVLYVPDALKARIARDWRAPGSVDERLVSFVDLAPTLLELAGVPAPDYLHGQNLFGAARGYVHAARDRIDKVGDRQRAVRDARFKFIRSWYPRVPGGHVLEYRDNLDMVRAMRSAYERGELDEDQVRWFRPPGVEQLYDLDRDPNELRNLATDPAYSGVRERLFAELERWRNAVGDTSDMPEARLRASLTDEGEVRTTPEPVVSVEARYVYAHSGVGASIGYRIGEQRWRLYVRPFPLIPGERVSVRAVRYGWWPSTLVEVLPD
ncbi:MAG: sulfatase [Pseudomonadales bacterium]|jgi:arylsulfatase A-like enzyme|nr:sulfatase [Pseudomonadales bacterium]MDP6827934.1 sulfatase [Pseudomonadales bacterium]MDP6973483.1 sulfatase [Pseudomonadales bacterium]